MQTYCPEPHLAILGDWILPDLRSFLRLMHECLEICFEDILVGFGHFDEPEGLQPSLRGPHGKHHLHLFADCGFSEMKDQFHLQLFVERRFNVQQSAGGGDLMQLAPHLAPVGQTNQRQDRTSKLYTKWAWSEAWSAGRPGF